MWIAKQRSTKNLASGMRKVVGHQPKENLKPNSCLMAEAGFEAAQFGTHLQVWPNPQSPPISLSA
jgi:hypothetical protein